MKKKSYAFASALALAAITAQAQTTPPAAPGPQAAAAATPEPPASPFTANISVTTNYKFRGQDQGTLRYFSPAIQGGFDWSQNGWYLGNWNSNVSFAGNIEMDFYGGYKGEIAKDFGYDVGILQYFYPQRQHPAVNPNTTEIYGALTYLWASLKYSHTVSSDYFGIGEAFQGSVPLTSRPKGRNTGYLDLSANYPLIDKLTLNGHVGYTRYASDLRNVKDAGGVTIGTPNFYDFKLGVTYDLGSGFSVAGALVGANKRSYYHDANKTRAILTVSKSM
ncbi:MAG TPA: TorF family putative porin [Caldimonas sp.]|jgi:uncharacterized protein (TIGR02001 family)|nr:TorF family putative porin [Caldimonas sp.]